MKTSMDRTCNTQKRFYLRVDGVTRSTKELAEYFGYSMPGLWALIKRMKYDDKTILEYLVARKKMREAPCAGDGCNNATEHRFCSPKCSRATRDIERAIQLASRELPAKKRKEKKLAKKKKLRPDQCRSCNKYMKDSCTGIDFSQLKPVFRPTINCWEVIPEKTYAQYRSQAFSQSNLNYGR